MDCADFILRVSVTVNRTDFMLLCCSLPAPLCFLQVEKRLRNGYYRSIAAVMGDIRVIEENARIMFGDSHQAGQSAQHLCEALVNSMKEMEMSMEEKVA